MTEFIIGKACADVTGRLRSKLIKEIRSGRRVLMIVPDQFEFETEKALYRACAAEGDTSLFTRISVKTPDKLASEIIAKYAGEKKPADDITKHILMYRAVSEIKDELTAFDKIALKPGFAPRMTGTVAMLKSAGISASALTKTVDSVKEDFRDTSPSLFAKLCDISRIYSVYDSLLSRSYSDKADSTMIAARLAAENGVFRGENIFCDGFSDFSAGQMELLYSMIDLADNMTFSFVSDNGRDIFNTVNSCITLLSDHSRNADKDVIGDDRIISDNEHFCSPAIAAVSEGIFSEYCAFCMSDGLRLIKADDIHKEADFIAAEIRSMITKENYRCSEIAVLASDADGYRAPIESAFEKYGIPLFSDVPETILHLPLVNLVLSLLNVLKSFTVENVLSYLKTGFLQKSNGKPLTMRDINDFEEYIYEWNLKPQNLKDPFPERNDNVPRAEKLRADIIPPLLELREQLKSSTGDEITKAVCDFLFDKVGIQRAVAAHCKRSGSELLSDSDEKLISSYQTLWNTMLEIFEGLYRGLDGYKISLSDYCDLVRDICAGTSLAKPPQVLDAVLMGDIGRTRLDGIRAVFIAGANYGLFPAEQSPRSIFTEYETELLGESIIKIGMNRRERYLYGRYLTYRALSIPSERLCISYPMLDSACAKMSPSDVIKEITEMFDDLRTENASEFGDDLYCSTTRAAQQNFAAICRTDSTRRATLKKALVDSGSGNIVKKLEQLTSKQDTAYRHRLDPTTSEALFRSRTFSATKLERLNHCRFEYFCTNGLRIREKKQRDLSSLEIGNAVHYVLQKVLEKYCADMEGFIRLTRPQLAVEARHYLDEYKEQNLGGDYAKSLRFGYLYKNLTIGAVDILILLQAEFAARDYRPKFFELQIGSADTATAPISDSKPQDTTCVPEATLTDDAEITFNEAVISDTDDTNIPGSSRTAINTPALSVTTKNGTEVNITGIIDRADIFTDKDGNEYIRVVDYKTGTREFSMVNLYYGINTQMLLYLIAVCSANPELHPGGVSYLPARVTEPADKLSAPFALLAQDHVQSGMYVRTDATDAEMTKYATVMSARSGAKPAKFIPKEENNLSEGDFKVLTEDCIHQTEYVLSKLYSGSVDAVPTVYREKNQERSACAYCRFGAICGHSKEHELHAVPKDDTKKKKTKKKAKGEPKR